MVLISPFVKLLMSPAILVRLRYVPSLPRFARAKYAPSVGSWNVDLPSVPQELRTIPGIWRDSHEEELAFAKQPLHDFATLHPEPTDWSMRSLWRALLPMAPRLVRGSRRAAQTARAVPASQRSSLDPVQLTQAIRVRAAQLGLSAIGIARYDPKYTFEEFRGEAQGDRVIVCILEQNYALTQKIPSVAAEKAAFSCYAELFELSAKLAGFLHQHGYHAKACHLPGDGIVIHYGVEAGLGQLGLNGQLLTPVAGSRCRITLISTDAPLTFDQPVDYGIHAICDRCQVCVRRCPSGAIPANRAMYRGVVKAKVNTARCAPVVAQAHGCGVCMKVCPVQKYGLGPVLEEFKRSGRILGKDTEELEGYDFQGDHYGPGERPRLERAFFSPPGFNFDPQRTVPPGAVYKVFV